MRLFAVITVLALPAVAHAEDGKALFATRCAACHAPTAAKSGPASPKIGGVAGRRIASLTDYGYSTALKSKGGQAWTDANLDTYLTAPARFAPGTKMFVALPKADDRKVVIAYLKTLK